MISPTKVGHVPNQSGTLPPLKYTRSPGENEHNQKHHANQKFGWHQIRQIRRVMALIYILYVKYMYFSTFFCNIFFKKLPGTNAIHLTCHWKSLQKMFYWQIGCARQKQRGQVFNLLLHHSPIEVTK
jgi:hypothetical protein